MMYDECEIHEFWDKKLIGDVLYDVCSGCGSPSDDTPDICPVCGAIMDADILSGYIPYVDGGY